MTIELSSKRRNKLLNHVTKTLGQCWIWKGWISRGYGKLYYRNRVYFAHRFFYELLNGEIENGLVLDHLCKNTACVNPDHLEPVTQKENVLRSNNFIAVNARKTHCLRGHEFSTQNTRIQKNGGRVCRQCKRIYQRNYMSKQ